MVCFPVRNMPRSGFWVVCVRVWWPLAATVSASVLHFVLSKHWILGQFKARLIFSLQSTSICHFSGNRVEIIFRLLSLRTKWNGKKTDGETAKTVREQGCGGHGIQYYDYIIKLLISQLISVPSFCYSHCVYVCVRVHMRVCVSIEYLMEIVLVNALHVYRILCLG